MPPKPPTRAAEADPVVAAIRRALARRDAAVLDSLVAVVGVDGRSVILEDRRKLATRLQRSDPGVAWWLTGETCAPGECLAMVSVDDVRQVVRVRVRAGGGEGP